MPRLFKITKRHYDLVIKQAIDNLPQESGGFLGGKDDVIQAVLPTHNQHLYNKTDTYALTDEDFDRSRQFFEKHGLHYYGVYHSHPNGAAIPSQTDIDTKQQYHFIIGLKDPKQPILAAYEIQNGQPIPIPLEILGEAAYSTKDLHSDQSKPRSTTFDAEDTGYIDQLHHNLRHEESSYPKLKPKLGSESQFTTEA